MDTFYADTLFASLDCPTLILSVIAGTCGGPHERARLRSIFTPRYSSHGNFFPALVKFREGAIITNPY
jgi:hypothetical protein